MLLVVIHTPISHMAYFVHAHWSCRQVLYMFANVTCGSTNSQKYDIGIEKLQVSIVVHNTPPPKKKDQQNRHSRTGTQQVERLLRLHGSLIQ